MNQLKNYGYKTDFIIKLIERIWIIIYTTNYPHISNIIHSLILSFNTL